jgi:thiol-disulfide isomerase/thioredoxin
MKSFSFAQIQRRAFYGSLWPVFASMGMLACLTGAGVAHAADAPDAKRVLSHAASVYQNLKSYQAQIRIQTIDGPKIADQRFSETGSGNAYRCEESGTGGLVFLSDGQTDWALDGGANVYTKSGAGRAKACIGQLAEIDQNVKDATLDDEELYWLNGMPVKTYVVEVTRTSWPASSPAGAQSVTYTIDEQTFNVYKAITYTNMTSQVALYTFTQGNETTAAGQFAFTPPASAKEVNFLPARPLKYSSIVGMQAPDFSLEDAAGNTHKLSDFKDKVVIVDFVGSWCPPCLAQMPYLQQENDTYPPNDLEVIGLDVGEDAKQVNEFGLNAAYTFPLLLGAEPDVTTAYFVGDYPTTYIISRDGRIVFKATGTQNPGGFLAAVKAAVAQKK